MTAADLARTFARPGMRVVIEAGNQAFWVNRELVRLGHEVLVLDARQMDRAADGERRTGKTRASWCSGGCEQGGQAKMCER